MTMDENFDINLSEQELLESRGAIPVCEEGGKEKPEFSSELTEL